MALPCKRPLTEGSSSLPLCRQAQAPICMNLHFILRQLLFKSLGTALTSTSALHCRPDTMSLPSQLAPHRMVRATATGAADMGIQSLPSSPVQRQSAPGSPEAVRPPKSAFCGERSTYGGSALGKKSYSRMPSADGGGIGKPPPPSLLVSPHTPPCYLLGKRSHIQMSHSQMALADEVAVVHFLPPPSPSPPPLVPGGGCHDTVCLPFYSHSHIEKIAINSHTTECTCRLKQYRVGFECSGAFAESRGSRMSV